MEEKKNRSGLLIKIGIGVCVAVMIVSGGFLIKDTLEEKKGRDTYSSLEQYLKPPPASPDVTPDEPVTPTEPPESAPEETAGPEEIEPEDETEAPDKEPVYVDNPAPDYWPVVDFEGLREVNSQIVAWIISPGTNINYPVVRGGDNDYYLNHLVTGGASKVGSIFMDYRNHADFSHRNTIIYGHHMRNRSMFWTLTNYRSQPYFNSHPAVRLVTPGGNYEIRIIASYVASVEDDAWRIGFENSDGFLEWIDAARAKSDIRSDVEVAENDRIVTLSTCTYEFSNARYIVMGKLVTV